MEQFQDVPQEKNACYPWLRQQLDALTQGIPFPIANLANLSALLYQSLPQLNWAGFYLLQGDTLVLGPFQGKTACMLIPVGRGVCGTAAAAKKAQCVPDVHCFPGHIACDSASASEVVIPLLKEGQLYGVLDLDSPIQHRFGQADVEGLTGLCQLLMERCDFSQGLLGGFPGGGQA